MVPRADAVSSLDWPRQTRRTWDEWELVWTGPMISHGLAGPHTAVTASWWSVRQTLSAVAANQPSLRCVSDDLLTWRHDFMSCLFCLQICRFIRSCCIQYTARQLCQCRRCSVCHSLWLTNSLRARATYSAYMNWLLTMTDACLLATITTDIKDPSLRRLHLFE